MIRTTALMIAASLLAAPVAARGQDTTLAGLWQSTRYTAPRARGELRITSNGSQWQATIGSRTAPVQVSGDSVHFSLPSTARFTGHFIRGRSAIMGQWIEVQTAQPVVMTACGAGCYSARIESDGNQFTFYMEVKPRPDGTLGAFLRNPERNQGRFIGLDHLVRQGNVVYLRNKADSTIEQGLIREDNKLSVYLRGATHDFEKVKPGTFTYFYPRGFPTATYTYSAPRAKGDGWTVARARDVGMSEEKLAEMVRTIINSSVDSANAYRPHGIIVARHGKLVLEEYMFGGSAEQLHNTRSAAKTLVTVVLGAAMHAGMNVSPSTPVFSTMGLNPATLDPRKRAVQLRHLITMTSGLDCDDWEDEYHPGSEEFLTNQDSIPDWLSVVVGLKMLREPGAKGVYCSINPFLAGNVIERATGKSFLDLAWDLVGAPLQMGRYLLVLDPVGHSYMGGGSAWTLRDFTKFAQLYANGGTWNGKRIVSSEWVRESLQPRQGLSPLAETSYLAKSDLDYGYLWWSTPYKYQGREIRAYYASGNGGQFSVVIPDLDLVVGGFGGNYNDRGGFFLVKDVIPRWIIPAITGR
jgi:CubicO group peptidase (beta-lactamase class C family)